MTRSAINADNKGTSLGLLVPFADDWTDLVLRAHGEANLRPHATWQEMSLIVAVDRQL